MTDPEFSRKMGKILNSPYFYGNDSPMERQEQLFKLRVAAASANNWNDFSLEMRDLAEKAWQTIKKR